MSETEPTQPVQPDPEPLPVSDSPAELVEDDPAPKDGPVIGPDDRDKRRDETRKNIAYGMIGILVVLILLGGGGWLFWGDDTQRMQNFAIVFSPVVTLVASILGYYFSSKD